MYYKIYYIQLAAEFQPFFATGRNPGAYQSLRSNSRNWAQIKFFITFLCTYMTFAVMKLLRLTDILNIQKSGFARSGHRLIEKGNGFPALFTDRTLYKKYFLLQ